MCFRLKIGYLKYRLMSRTWIPNIKMRISQQFTLTLLYALDLSDRNALVIYARRLIMHFTRTNLRELPRVYCTRVHGHYYHYCRHAAKQCINFRGGRYRFVRLANVFCEFLIRRFCHGIFPLRCFSCALRNSSLPKYRRIFYLRISILSRTSMLRVVPSHANVTYVASKLQKLYVPHAQVYFLKFKLCARYNTRNSTQLG